MAISNIDMLLFYAVCPNVAARAQYSRAKEPGRRLPVGDVTCPPQENRGDDGLEPATSDVTGASASPLFSAKYMVLQWVAPTPRDTARHEMTRFRTCY